MDEQVRELLEGRNFAHLATLLPDGSPHSVVIWVTVVEGDRAAFFTQPGSLKARNVARDPRVAISIVDHERPYRTARLRGRVVATREGDAALEVMDAMSQRYTGADFPMRSGVLYEVEVEQDSFTELPFRH
ncbi:MAG: PPOX class F420-dependent oxidoreductase [Solirubrobacteraceae bacterium]